MATTYAELQTEIADFLNRDDLTSIIPTFISLAEAQFNRDIRHWEMETRQTATANEQYLTKPADWIESIRLTIPNGTIHLLSRDALAVKRDRFADTAGTPEFYCHSGNTFELYPTPDSDITTELLYYAKIPVLSDSNTSNWLLDLAPDVYLYGALLHTSAYLQEDNRLTTWSSLYGNAVGRLNEDSNKARFSGSGLKLKVRGLG